MIIKNKKISYFKQYDRKILDYINNKKIYISNFYQKINIIIYLYF